MALAKDNKEYTFQHIVPKTYIEVWENEDNFLKIRKNGSDKAFYKSPQTFMGENNYYTITADDFLIHTESDLEEIFGELKEYKILIDGKETAVLKDFSSYYKDIDQWDIFNEDGSIADKTAIKKSLSSKRILDIEFGFHAIESDWNIIRDEIQNASEDKTYKLNLEVADRLVDFIVTQKDRTETRKKEYKKIIDTLTLNLKDSLGEDNYNEIFNEHLEAYFKKTVRKYQEGEEGTAGRVLEEKIRELTTVIYTATGNKHFVTSDNPVLMLSDKTVYKGSYNGLYMAITPKIMIGLYHGDNMRYRVRQMPVNLMKRINRKIIQEANRFYIEVDK